MQSLVTYCRRVLL